MTIKERLVKFAKSKERSVRAFEREAGLTIGYVNTIRVSVQPDKLQRIASRYPDLNTEWLMTGVGPMTRGGSVKTSTATNKAETPNVFTAPLLPLAAQGGTLRKPCIYLTYKPYIQQIANRGEKYLTTI